MTVSLNSVPYLSNQDIQQLAWNLIWNFAEDEKWEISTPIPVEHIAEIYLGYQIEITDEGIFKEPAVLGGIVFEHNTIQINGAIEHQEGRYNFTVAHEIGHHSLHKGWLGSLHNQQNLFGADNTPAILCREVGVKPRGEVQADTFAAAILMPEVFVMQAYKTSYTERIDVSLSGGISPILDNPRLRAKAIATQVIEAGKFKNVSNNAMINRLLGLKLISGLEYQKNTPEPLFA